jgi:ferritin-like metal-binding protein YciE
MGIFSKDIKSMEDLFIHGLRDIYYAENQIIKALPQMVDQATNRDLSGNLQSHLEQTRKQVERLDKVFEKLGWQPNGTACPAIDGIIKEANELRARSRTRPCSMQRLWRPHRQSSITRFAATGR